MEKPIEKIEICGLQYVLNPKTGRIEVFDGDTRLEDITVDNWTNSAVGFVRDFLSIHGRKGFDLRIRKVQVSVEMAAKMIFCKVGEEYDVTDVQKNGAFKFLGRQYIPTGDLKEDFNIVPDDWGLEPIRPATRWKPM